MKNQTEKAPRALEVLIQEFKNSAGNFASFNNTMDARERTMFKGWLQQMRNVPVVS